MVNYFTVISVYMIHKEKKLRTDYPYYIPESVGVRIKMTVCYPIRLTGVEAASLESLVGLFLPCSRHNTQEETNSLVGTNRANKELVTKAVLIGDSNSTLISKTCFSYIRERSKCHLEHSNYFDIFEFVNEIDE